MDNPGSQTNGGRLIKIGITGGAGSGKSMVCRRLDELGVPVCSADELARQAVEPGTRAFDQIVAHFGDGILTPQGTIDRPRLRRIIVGDEAARRTLESFVHPEVLARMEKHFETAAAQGSPAAGAEVPLLFEGGLERFFDVVILVASDTETRVQRVMARDSVSRQDAEALMNAQMPEAQKRPRADYIVENNGSVEQLRAEVDRIYEALRSARKNLDKNC